MEQMQRTNMSKEVIDRYCNGIEFDCMSCMVHAICMKNLNGGLEIYSDIYCQSPVTFGKKGLTFIKRKPQKDAEDSHLLLFADYIDFLAYESLHGQIFKEIPDWSDVLILNQVTNLNAWLETIGNENYGPNGFCPWQGQCETIQRPSCCDKRRKVYPSRLSCLNGSISSWS